MKRQPLSLLACLLAVAASAQTRAVLDPALAAPRVFAPAFPFASGLGPAAAMPLLAPSALTPALTASVFAPAAFAPSAAAAPSALAAPAAAAYAAPSALAASASAAAAPALALAHAAPSAAAAPFGAAQALGARLAAAPSAAAPALAAAFDGRAAAAADDGTPAGPADARGPEEFALRGRALFEGVLRAERGRAAAAPESVATDDEMRGRLERLPTTNPEREKYVVDLFTMAGAKPEEIVLQDAGRGRHNIFVVKKGRTDRVIVVGGHHDKVSVGAGSIDNGTGSTMVANLYQALHDQDTEATIVFVAFAREEEGLIGSQHYLAALSPEQRAKVDAMVNLDTLAVDGTFSWKNNSTQALLDRIREVAAGNGRALTEAHLDGGDADSTTFRDAGIPAITVFGASQDVIFDIIHTERDTMAAFDLGHYRNAYLLTLDLLKSLDARPLGRVDGV